MRYYRFLLLTLTSVILLSLNASAQEAEAKAGTALDSLETEADAAPKERIRTYTKENPLIYEGSWDLWPYTFLHEDGTPDGYSVELVRLILNRLNIPYETRLKAYYNVFNDLKEGRADLVLAIAAGFHDRYGHYGKTSVTLFTQSVATPKGKPVLIKTFNDLAHHKVIVNQGSLCYNLMVSRNWGDNAIPTKDIREAMLKLSNDEEGMIVWNDLSLKWLQRQYQLDNLQITPITMPHGEYKFMSNDPKLLADMDSVYLLLSSEEQITPIYNKWFYPEREEKQTPLWVLISIISTAILALIFIVHSIIYRIQARRITQENNRRNYRLALILETSQVHIWTYDVAAQLFTWYNEDGKAAYTYTPEEFSQRYKAEDYKRLRNTILRLTELPKPENGKEEEVKMTIKAKDTESGNDLVHDYTIALSVLDRDKNGKTTVIIGTKKDITDAIERERLDDERTLRYWAIFNTPQVGILLFDKDCILTNINPRACQMFKCNHDEAISSHVSISDIFGKSNMPLDDMDGHSAVQHIDLDKIPFVESLHLQKKSKGILSCEYSLMLVRDESGIPFCLYAICNDISSNEKEQEAKAQVSQEISSIQQILEKYDHSIDDVIHESDVRLATYSPTSHVLSIYRSATEVLHALTQTRCMSLVDDRSKKLTMRVLADMDDLTDKEIKADIRTTLRVKGLPLYIQFRLMPIVNQSGQVTEYLGVCRDFSELDHIRQDIAVKEAMVDEVDKAKTSFMKNMVQEIQKPMNTVTQYAAALKLDKPGSNDEQLKKGILNNADYLLHLIENVLLLSRLEAHVQESHKEPCDIAQLFEKHCERGWSRFRNSNTRYQVENLYDKLVLDIDADNLGHAITQLTANAAQHTHHGNVRTRYVYIGRRLIITVDDTGEGIPKEELDRINTQMKGQERNIHGLGLAICKEIVAQMNGSLEINSEEGVGTTVYITIPCHASVIKRKKYLEHE